MIRVDKLQKLANVCDKIDPKTLNQELWQSSTQKDIICHSISLLPDFGFTWNDEEQMPEFEGLLGMRAIAACFEISPEDARAIFTGTTRTTPAEVKAKIEEYILRVT